MVSEMLGVLSLVELFDNWRRNLCDYMREKSKSLIDADVIEFLVMIEQFAKSN